MQPSFRLGVVAILIVSTVIDEVITMSILFGVVEKGNQSISIAVLLLAQLMPSVLLAPYGGHAVDKYGARRVVIVTGLLELPVLFALSYATTVLHIYVLSAVMSALFAFSGPAIFAMIPSAAARAGLSVERANSLIEVVGGLGTIIGPVLGGLSVGALPLHVLIQITAGWALFLVISIAIARIDSAKTEEGKPSRNFFSQFRTSYRPILRLPQIRFLYLTFFAIVYSTTFSDVIFVFFVLMNLKGGPFEVGVLIGLWSLGLTIGAWYAGGKRESGDVIRYAYLGAIGMGVSLILTGLSTHLLALWHATVAVGILFVVGGAGNGIHNVAVRDSIFRYVPEGQHGRAFSLYSLITRVAAVLGYFSGGLSGADNAAITYAISGLLATIFGLAGLSTFRNLVSQKQ